MSEPGPPPVPSWTGVLVLLLTAVGVASAAAAPAMAESAAVPDADLDGLDATEAGSPTEPVEYGTGGGTVSEAENATAGSPETDAVGPVGNATAGSLETDPFGPVGNATTALTAPVDPTVDWTTGAAVSFGSPGMSVALVPAVGSTAVAADGADAGGAGDGTASMDPESDTGMGPSRLPLAAGSATVGGAVAAGVVLRRGYLLANAPWSADGSLVRTSSRMLAASTDAGWPDWLRWLGGLFGYQRYDDTDPLEHDSRAAILQVVEGADGAYQSEISRTTGIPLSTVRYHLRVLEHENLVTATKMRGKRVYVPLGAEPSALEAALKDDAAAAVLAAISEHGPASVSDLARALDRDVSTVSHHLQRLAEEGLVTRERDGRAVVNRLAADVRESLERPAAAAFTAPAPPQGLDVQTD